MPLPELRTPGLAEALASGMRDAEVKRLLVDYALDGVAPAEYQAFLTATVLAQFCLLDEARRQPGRLARTDTVADDAVAAVVREPHVTRVAELVMADLRPFAAGRALEIAELERLRNALQRLADVVWMEERVLRLDARVAQQREAASLSAPKAA